MDKIGGIEIKVAKNWIMNAMAIGERENDRLLSDIFSVYLESMLHNQWRGACHDLSTAFYMTLSEYDLKPTLCTGVVRSESNDLFDHSWVEINNKIYDFAICYPLTQGKVVSPPIFASKNLDNKMDSNLTYGVKNIELDDTTLNIVESTINEYANSRPHSHKDMYEIAAEFGSIIPHNPNRKNLDPKKLKEKYSSHKRTLKRNIA
ncbi:lasso peptide biosynthesis protein [Vibrio fluvialis]|uniref:lasso peptide biosynthesis protein n=1 Tax=Vibrio sp. bablab_jr001 TaxID=2755067 RepID=UPI0018F24D79|nr:lasso peptide biosynthesis protein [Vibrio sp. bablab_jr001]MBY8066505.1 lasso peptide biosynthesis protein [Vibrio fluvialis]MBY8133386.1 lasso peptide biosynthesis protein [Vibrio fluvialis]